MIELLKIFQDSLWRASWLFEEIPFKKEEIYAIIKEICTKTLDFLSKSNSMTSYHYKYMHLYCEYLQCGCNNTSCAKQTEHILYNINNLLKVSNTHQSMMLNLLAGYLCSLSSKYSDFALIYYTSIHCVSIFLFF